MRFTSYLGGEHFEIARSLLNALTEGQRRTLGCEALELAALVDT